MDVRAAEEYYRRIGFSRRIGLGERPALLIVDCNHGCADPTVSPIGIAMEAEIGHIRRLLDEIVPALAPRPGELVLEKRFASAFCGTSLHAYLTARAVDTVIVTGNSTSGCVRATVVDAISAGFRPIVPRQCVADRVPLSHVVNLFDMDSKYADVMDVEEVIAALERVAAAGDER